MNTVKHGMTARISVLPGEDPDAFRELVDGFVASIQPQNTVEAALAQQAALALWKTERGERADAARVASALRAAEAIAHTEHAEEVAALGHWLRATSRSYRVFAATALLPFLSADLRDVFACGRGDPLYVVLRLERTVAGCAFLRYQWAWLRDELEQGNNWRTNELIFALQLRGWRPLECDSIDWHHLLEPIGPDGDPAQVALARSWMIRQFAAGLPEDPAEERAALMRWVDEEDQRLVKLKAEHRRRAAAERAELPARLGVDLTAAGERLRRYQAENDRKLNRALNTLARIRREGIGAADEPEPETVETVETIETVEAVSDPADGPGCDSAVEVSPEPEGDGPGHDDRPVDGVRLFHGDDPSIIADPELVTPPVTAAADPIGPAEPEGDPAARNEPSPAVGGDRIAPNKPSGATRPASARSSRPPAPPHRQSTPAIRRARLTIRPAWTREGTRPRRHRPRHLTRTPRQSYTCHRFEATNTGGTSWHEWRGS